jgi:hypothetical protein
MAEQNEPNKSVKAEDTVKRRKRKPLEYQRFERMLKMAVNTPPMRKPKKLDDSLRSS